MAIEKVLAAIDGDSGELTQQGEKYSGTIRAPSASGYYSVSISAYDDAGNVTIGKSAPVEVTLWSPPKVNWKPTDRFNWWDYNRIMNNLAWLHETAVRLYRPFDIVDMGENITSYSVYWDVKYFNAWEENLEIINEHVPLENYGTKQTFYENGQFIKWDELNRIENATLALHDILVRQSLSLRKLPFRLGTFKEVRV